MKFFVLKLEQSSRATILLLTLMIISALLSSTIIVGDFMNRLIQATKGTELSEIAYFAAESGTEKILYRIFKEYCDLSSCGISGSLWAGGPSYEINNSKVIPDTVNSSWSKDLAINQSLKFSLDLNGFTYPNSIIISQAGTQATDLIILERDKSGTVWSTTVSTSVLPYTLMVDANKYYMIRINNLGTETETYSLSFDGQALAVGTKIESTGTYKNYTRILQSISPKWQIWSFTP